MDAEADIWNRYARGHYARAAFSSEALRNPKLRLPDVAELLSRSKPRPHALVWVPHGEHTLAVYQVTNVRADPKTPGAYLMEGLLRDKTPSRVSVDSAFRGAVQGSEEFKALATAALPDVVFPTKEAFRALDATAKTKVARERQRSVQAALERWYQDPRHMVALYRLENPEASSARVRSRVLKAYRALEGAFRGGEAKVNVLGFLLYEMGARMDADSRVISGYAPNAVAEVGSVGGSLRHYGGKYGLLTADPANPVDAHLLRGQVDAEALAKSEIGMPGELANRLKLAMSDVRVLEEDCGAPTLATVAHKALDPAYHEGAFGEDGVALTPEKIAELRKREGSVRIRTTKGCATKGGVCGRCCGRIRALDGISKPGDPVAAALGFDAGLSLTEPLQQAVISSFKNATMVQGETSPLMPPVLALLEALDALPATTDPTKATNAGLALSDTLLSFGFELDPTLVRLIANEMADAERKTWLKKPAPLNAVNERGYKRPVGRDPERALAELKRLGVVEEDVTLDDVFEDMNRVPGILDRARLMTEEEMQGSAHRIDGRVPYADEDGRAEYDREWNEKYETNLAALQKDSSLYRDTTPEQQILLQIRTFQDDLSSLVDLKDRDRRVKEIDLLKRNLWWMNAQEFTRRGGVYDQIRKDKRKTGRWASTVYAYLTARPQRKQDRVDVVEVPAETIWQVYRDKVLDGMEAVVKGRDRLALSRLVRNTLDAAREGRTTDELMYVRVSRVIRAVAKANPVLVKRYPLTHRHNEVALNVEVHDNPADISITLHNALLSGYAGDFDGDGYKIYPAPEGVSKADLFKRKGPAMHMLKFGDGSAQMMPAGDQGEGLVYWTEAEGVRGVVKRSGLTGKALHALQRAANRLPEQGPIDNAKAARKLMGRLGVEIAREGEVALEVYSALWMVGAAGKKALLKLPGALHVTVVDKNTATPYRDGLLHIAAAAKAAEGNPVDVAAIEAKLEKAKDVPLEWQTKGGETLAQVPQGWFAANVESSRQAEILNLRRTENLQKDRGVMLPRNQAFRRPDGRPVRKLTGRQRDLSDTVINTLIRNLGAKEFKIEDTRGPEGVTFVESTRGVVNEALIHVNLSTDTAVRTVGHEVIHVLRRGGIFTDEQWADLAKQAEAKWLARYGIATRYPELSRELQIEEAVSEAFGEMLHDTKFRNDIKGLARKALWFLGRVLRILGRKLLNMNIYTWHDYFDAVADGRIMKGMDLGQSAADRDVKQRQRLGKGGAGLSEEARMRAVPERTAEGDPAYPQPAALERASTVIRAIARSVNRVSEMPNTTENAEYLMAYRELGGAHELGDRKSRQALVDVFDGLTPQQEGDLDFIAVVLDANEGYKEDIQSALSREEVERLMPRVRELLKDTVLQERYTRWRNWADALRDALIERGMLDPAVVRKKHHFHRIILKYQATARAPIVRQNGLARSHAFRREGSKEPYSGSLRESMQALLYTGHRQAVRNDVAEKIRANPRINFKESANEIVTKYNARLLKKRMAARGRDDGEVKLYRANQTAISSNTHALRDALKAEVTEEIRASIPERLRPVYETFMQGEEAIEANRLLPVMAFTRWVADNKDEHFSPELANTADKLFADVLKRNVMAKKLVGEDYVDPYNREKFVDGLKKARERFPDLDITPHLPKGYALDDLATVVVDTRWGGRHDLLAQIADPALYEELVRHIKTVERDKAIPDPVWAAMDEFLDATQVRMVHGSSREWVLVHQGVATDMEALNPEVTRRPTGPVARALQQGTSWYKQILLVSAPQFLGYQIRNLSGDLEGAFIADPELFRPKTFNKYFRRAIQGGLRVDVRNEPGSVRDERAIRQGVYNTGEGHAELSHEIAREGLETEAGVMGRELDAILKESEGGLKGPMTVARVAKVMWGGLTGRKLAKYNLFRENIIRRMMFEHLHDQLDAVREKGEVDLNDPVATARALGLEYKSVNMKVLRGIRDPNDMIAYFVRESLIDYQATSKFGLGMGGSRLAIPFYGWMHGNAKRFYHQFRNLGYAWTEQGAVGGMRASMRASGVLLARTLTFTALISLYNGMRRALSPHCGEGHESRPQVILWCDEEHTITLSTPGALIDLASWTGISGYEDVAAVYRGIESGRMTGMDAVMGVAQAMAGKAGASLGPPLKVPLEVAGGVSFFPDPFDPRPIEGGMTGKVRHVVRSFLGPTPSNLFDLWTGRPLPFGGEKHTAWDNFGFAAQTVAVKRVDTGRIAYNGARSMVFDWLDSNLPETGGARSGTAVTFAVTQLGLARRYGQKGLQRQWLRELVRLERERARALGRAPRPIRKLLKQYRESAHPLKHIPKNLQRRFLATLDPSEKRMFRQALRWWGTTF